jgi:VWFA-related protein
LAQESQIPVFRERVNIVIAPTAVLDGDGRHVNGLEPHNFKLYDNGRLQEIKEDISFVPISLVVAIQRSAKTELALPALQKMGSMLESLVIGEQGEAAIIGFDHRIETLCDFTNDGKKFQEALQKLKPGSYTSRQTDAVVAAVRLLKSRPVNRRRVLLLISETRDGGSEGKVREALTELQLHNVIVYPVNMSYWVNKLLTPDQPARPSPIPPSARPMPTGVPQTPTSAAQMGVGGTFGSVLPLVKEIFVATKSIFVDNPQELYSKYTGGVETNFVGLKGLEQAMDRIGDELHSQYLLSYNPNNKEDGGYHTIQVVVNKPGLKVRTRAGYWMAAVPN